MYNEEGRRRIQDRLDAFLADPGVTMVEIFHRAYGFVVRDEPGVPELSGWEKSEVLHYTATLANLARRLKLAAAQANDLGQTNLGLVLIRMQLHVEENAELFQAIVEGDLPHVLQEISDVSFVTDGTYLTLGLQHYKPAADMELLRANMSKLGPGGRPIVDASGRSVKGPDFVPPDMARVLAKNQ
jgi:predicted HAD superfamily Cof-like phosphohydrolase